MVDTNWGGAAKGAAGGAAAGAAFGPWGAAIGGIAGGALGLFSGGGDGGNTDAYRQQLDLLAQKYGAIGAPQAGPAQQAQQSQFRGNQAGLISQLESMARGEGPSAAAIQMREAMDRAAAAQTSAAAGAGGRGVNQGAAYLNAANNGAAIMAQGARDTATLRAQEQLNAVGQLGQTIGQARQGDEQMNQFNAGAANQTSMANLQAQLSALGLTSETQLRALTANLGSSPQQPSLGTQIMAGGATALPSLLQYNQGKDQMAFQKQQAEQAQRNYQAQQPGYNPLPTGTYWNP